jgi:ribonucleoside-diphosphate reductase alpha chain
MAESAWKCGDPGMQYDTTVNRWHTCKSTARINASNPCSEYMFLDDTACNLASLNLMKYLNSNGTFDVEAFRHAVDITITAQEILVDNASYPTPRIADNSHKFRPLGLGYANLGALLMSMALPYDSDGGRDMAGAVTALMCGEAYAQSARVAERLGPFPGYAANREPMLDVVRMHRDSLRPIKPENVVQPSLLGAAQTAWDTALALGEKFGYKNSQVTVLAPTGTIGFMMDCDTTGVEPDLALVKYKKLVGGGVIKIVNNTVPQALMHLGYSPEETSQMVSYIDRNGKIEGAPGFKPEHLAVFDCSLATVGGRSIAWRGHLKMMAATQPFLSGAISKTINMPEESTVEDVMQAYIESWKLGVKAVAIYRDNSKGSQPLSAAGDKKDTAQQGQNAPAKTAETASGLAEQRELFIRARRRKLPSERLSITHKFSISGHEGYITVGMYETGEPGEIFIKMAKEGSTLSGFMDGFALSVSIGLQYGVPLKTLVDKFINTRFEPAGYTGHPAIPYAKSVLDYIARWLGGRFISAEYLTQNGEGGLLGATLAMPVVSHAVSATAHDDPPSQNADSRPMFDGAPTCSECGMLMTPNGACYKCENCGGTSGCS